MKKKLKLKKKNCSLLVIGIVIFLCFMLEICYTLWIFNGGPTIPSSDEVNKCFKEHHKLLGDCLYSIANSSKALKKNVDDNLYYVGNNPNNYLDLGEKYSKEIYRGYSLTNELDYQDYPSMSACLDANRKCFLKYHVNDPILWRIIGIFKINNQSYVKIIRSDSLGKYAWDSSSSDINEGYGVNEWSTSKLNDLLNNQFLNRQKADCFIGKENQTTACDFTIAGLSAQKYLYNAPWYLGSINDDEITMLSKIDWYNKERGNNTKLCSNGDFCTDNLNRQASYENYLGLMYPSDYLFSLNCEEDQCESSSWLTKEQFWTITPASSTNSNSYAIMFNKDTGFEATFSSNIADIYPVAYLKREVKIAGGFGTEESPYIIH